MSLKNPVTLLGIDPGTVRLVAQCLNHYATPGSVCLCVCVCVKLKVISNFTIQVKVKFTLEQATKAQRGSRGIALLFL